MLKKQPFCSLWKTQDMWVSGHNCLFSRSWTKLSHAVFKCHCIQQSKLVNLIFYWYQVPTCPSATFTIAILIFCIYICICIEDDLLTAAYGICAYLNRCLTCFPQTDLIYAYIVEQFCYIKTYNSISCSCKKLQYSSNLIS